MSATQDELVRTVLDLNHAHGESAIAIASMYLHFTIAARGAAPASVQAAHATTLGLAAAALARQAGIEAHQLLAALTALQQAGETIAVLQAIPD